jgi:hypothetical protein
MTESFGPFSEPIELTLFLKEAESQLGDDFNAERVESNILSLLPGWQALLKLPEAARKGIGRECE